jgi:AcrR family transcriptional regulator
MNRTPTPAAPARRQRSDGRRSRDTILDAAARLATVDGLEGLSIGNLAASTGMSKSGLYAHFGSKEELQLATIERANEIFDAEVLAPARRDGATGLRLLWALADEFLSHLQRDVFPGGCFFASVGAEVDSHPGVVHDRIARFSAEWMGALAAAAGEAIEAGEVDACWDASQLAYEVNAMLLIGHASYVMMGDRACLKRSRVGIERLLGPRP